MHEYGVLDADQVREKSARCSETVQNDDNRCKASALVTNPFGALIRRYATQ
jgi:hypothetical protein